MFKILKHLKGSWPSVLLILLLLVGQAVCDLALPQYTSDVVDVGIQQGGIAEVAPVELRAATMDALTLFMQGEDAQTVLAAYAVNAAGNYVLQAKDRETLDTLNRLFTLPMVILSQGQASGPLNVEMLLQAKAAGLLKEESAAAMREQAAAMAQGMPESMLSQRALSFVKAEYEALGMDMGRLQTNYLLLSGLKMLGVTLLMVVFAVLSGLLAARVSAKVGMDLRGRVFQRVVSFSSADMDKFSTASLITRSTNDVQQVQMTSVMLLRMLLYAPIIGIGGVLKVLQTNTGMGWLIFVAVLTILTLIFVLFQVAMPKFKRMQTLVDRINLIAREILTGLSVIRAFGRERHENGRFSVANTDLMRTQLFTNRAMAFMMPMMMLIMNGLTLAIVWFGAKNIDLGNLQVGDMMAFMTYAMQIVMAFLMLSMMSIFLPRASVAAGRIDEVLHTASSISDRPGAESFAGRRWEGVVAFEDVSFRYPNAEADVLSHIDFTARPGQITAIIGSTGSGKSTLLNLVPRFFDVTGGRVTLDGADIRDIPQKTLREQLGYVPQKGVLFSGTIESNLKYGGDTVTDEDMRWAADIAQASSFIEEKQENYRDPIAQGGSNVSGGQRQRLAIARAIAKKPKVLLFDDSFSALDYKTDAALRRALHERVRGATVLIVAQRISTVLHAEQIVVLDEGRMAGLGTHAELMESCRAYQEIARSQLSEEELKGGKSA